MVTRFVTNAKNELASVVQCAEARKLQPFPFKALNFWTWYQILASLPKMDAKWSCCQLNYSMIMNQDASRN
jgi:hypothetical protein